MKLATVVRTFNPAEAQLIRSRLEAAGIPAFVTHETAALTMDGYAMAAGGVLVQTGEAHVAEARALLELPAAPTPHEPQAVQDGVREAAPTEPSELVVVLRTLDPAEADLARSRLDAAGIPCVLGNDVAPLYLTPVTTGAILLQVPVEQAEEARSLLNSGPADDSQR